MGKVLFNLNCNGANGAANNCVINRLSLRIFLCNGNSGLQNGIPDAENSTRHILCLNGNPSADNPGNSQSNAPGNTPILCLLNLKESKGTTIYSGLCKRSIVSKRSGLKTAISPEPSAAVKPGGAGRGLNRSQERGSSGYRFCKGVFRRQPFGCAGATSYGRQAA